MDNPNASLTEMATFMRLDNVQTLKNWETRGPSARGLVFASRLGISSRWVESGIRPMVTPMPSDSTSVSDTDALPAYTVPRKSRGDRPSESGAASPATAHAPDAGYIRLPVLAEAAAGPGREPLPEVVQYVDVLESHIRQKLGTNPATVAVLTVRGSSMTGILEDGDIMFVQPTNEFTDDGIYILALDGLVRVKRLRVSMTTGMVSIESNDGSAAEQLPLKEVPLRLRIQGRVIGAWSMKAFP